MQKQGLCLLALLSVGICSQVHAQASWYALPNWKGTNASLGGILNTGNTRTKSLSVTANIQYTHPKWSDNTQLQGQFSSDKNITTKEKYFAQNQYNYTFNLASKKFVFVNGSVTVDKFSPYTFQTVLSTGYGCNLIKTRNVTFSVQAGPGVRRNKDRDTEKTDTKFIVATQANLAWSISKRANFTEAATYNLGRPYNYFKSVSAFTNKISGHWNWQVSFTLEHYSSVPPDKAGIDARKTDTTTSIALMYTL